MRRGGQASGAIIVTTPQEVAEIVAAEVRAAGGVPPSATIARDSPATTASRASALRENPRNPVVGRSSAVIACSSATRYGA